MLRTKGGAQSLLYQGFLQACLLRCLYWQNVPIRRLMEIAQQIQSKSFLSGLSSSFHHLTMLTLDPTTLFYWDIIHGLTPRFDTSTVAQWAESLPKDGKAKGQASSSSKHSSTSCSAPSLTNQSNITTSLVRTSDLCNPKRLPPPTFRVKLEANDDFKMGDVQGNEGAWNYHEDGVILERDEMEGQEHEEAMKSPPKGSGVRLDSKVCLFDSFPCFF